jgi:hypothetical protein
LNPFSTDFRYPDSEVSAEAAREAAKHAEKVRNFVRRKLELENGESVGEFHGSRE